MQSIVGDELVKGPYEAAKAGFEPGTLQTEGAKPYH